MFGCLLVELRDYLLFQNVSEVPRPKRVSSIHHFYLMCP